MSIVKNLTLVGASGHLGGFILDRLLASKFNVQVIKREGSTSTVPDQVKVVEAHFEDLGSLTAALTGQDVVVSTGGDQGLMGQKPLVDASIAAGVKRFIPSNFGSNMSNPNTRKLSVFQTKVMV